MHRVAVVIVNYKTLALTRQCVESLRKFYPKVVLYLVDNGSHDASTEYIRRLSRRDPHVQSVLNPRNLTHGPALHQGMRTAQPPYVFLLDSDSIVKQGNFLLSMLRLFEKDPQLYAVGRRELVNRNGVARKDSNLTLHVHPSAMMVDRRKYLQLPPFEKHCAPAVPNMRAVPKHGWKLKDFPIATYVRHLRGGTRKKFGSSWDPEHPLRPWKQQQEVPKRFASKKPKELKRRKLPKKPKAPKLAVVLEKTPILVPTYNAVDHLRRCVQALQRNTKVPYRLYIADAGSDSANLHKYLKDLESKGLATILRSETRKDFPTINNWAMRQIPTSVNVCLLNSDTEPTKGWLRHLLQELQGNKAVGIVGARLIYPSRKGALRGTIQHAGVRRTVQGAPYHVFRGRSANCVRANIRRELDAVTAACMLVRRKLWDQLGGFDEKFVGGHFEDVDFCWRARKAGWKIVYQPKAMLYHYEHGSGRTMVSQVSKRNLQRLMKKWPRMARNRHPFA